MSSSVIPVGANATKINAGNVKGILAQNIVSGNPVYFSDTQNVTTTTGIQLLPGTPLSWPADSELWCICAPGATSSMIVIDNGVELGVSVSALQTAINTLISVTQSVSTPQPQYVSTPLANTLYDANLTTTPGIYVVSCAAAQVANVDFYDVNGVYITTATTVAGTITLNIASTVGSIKFWSNFATLQIEIIKSGSSLAPTSGVLTTINASGTPGLKGDAYVVVVGGGGGGGATQGSGGGSGGITGGRVNLLGNEVATIGTAGVGGLTVGGTGGNGGSTTFAGFTATGGGGGLSGSGVGGTAGTPGGGTGGLSNGSTTPATASVSTSSIFSFFTQGTTGGGGGATSTPTTGAGSGLGTGGSAGGSWLPGGGGIGKGSGGGGGGLGGGGNVTGGAGAPGVVFIII